MKQKSARREPLPRLPLRTVRRGFSLVELIVVMAIIALLVSLGLPAIQRTRNAAAKTECLNNLRNIALAHTQFEQTFLRLPASGNILDPYPAPPQQFHSWTVSILPYLEQVNISQKWDFDKSIADPVNAPLTKVHIPVYSCPLDFTQQNAGDLSYAVNGGFGFTTRTATGVGDCPVSGLTNQPMDLNGDGQACNATASDDQDRLRFTQTGLFFVENWKQGGTSRHYALADIHDGLSQTFMVTDYVRVGFNPNDPVSSYASPDPRLCAFYIGLPCPTGSCTAGNINYSLCNSGAAKINSGLKSPEGKSPIPNSFHEGGVNMAYADGRVAFLSAEIDGAVYAALASPNGAELAGTLLKQAIVSDGSY